MHEIPKDKAVFIPQSCRRLGFDRAKSFQLHPAMLKDMISVLQSLILLFNFVLSTLFYSPKSSSLLDISEHQLNPNAMTAPVPGLPKMEYCFLGRSGLQVSAISIGGWLTFSGHVSNGKQ